MSEKVTVTLVPSTFVVTYVPGALVDARDERRPLLWSLLSLQDNIFALRFQTSHTLCTLLHLPVFKKKTKLDGCLLYINYTSVTKPLSPHSALATVPFYLLFF